MKAKKFINKTLYEKRLALRLDRKQASKLLHISSLKLKLIEKGYLGVGKKHQTDFINLYKLEPNFFSQNYNFPVEIDHQTDITQVKPLKRLIKKKWLRWTSVGILTASCGVVGYGVYCINKKEIKPTDKWTDNFRTFHQQMQIKGTENISILYPGDTKYVVTDKEGKTYLEGKAYCSVETYKKEQNASDTNFDALFYVQKNSETFPDVVQDGYFEFTTLIYNKKRIIYSSYYSPKAEDIQIEYATGVLDKEGSIDLKPFNYYLNNELKQAKEGSDVFNEFQAAFNYYEYKSFERINNVLIDNQLGYTEVFDLINDIQIITRDNVLHFRLGIWLTIIFSSLGAVSIFLLCLHFYAYYRHKKKTNVVCKKSIEQIALSAHAAKRDIKFRLFIPEFVLKIIGFIILALSAIATIMIVYTFFKGSFWDFLEGLKVNNFTNNFMVAGVCLLFFISLDNYSNKSKNQLIVNIFTFLLIGIAFYFAELTIYYSFSTRGNIFSNLFSSLSSLIPGNFFWPLGLYALLFLFLFITPESLKYNRDKLKTFRSMAVFPTIILVFNLVWSFAINPYVGDELYWLKFMFFSKGWVLIAFLLFYVYGLFIYRLLKVKRYGINYCEQVYYKSNEYSLVKNSIASGILLVILILDLLLKIAYKNDDHSFGNNWAIGIAIPLIMFYRPHIGARNAKWDYSCTFFINPICTLGGHIGAIIEIIVFLNMSEIFFILS